MYEPLGTAKTKRNYIPRLPKQPVNIKLGKILMLLFALGLYNCL